MIVILKHEARQEQIDRLKQFLLGMGLRIDESKGENSTILGLVGDTTRVDADLISSLDAVEAVRRVQEPYKKANRKFHPQDTMVDCGGVTIGHGLFQIIAGPCSVESEEQMVTVAKAVKAAGATLLRGGAFKPRTSPYEELYAAFMRQIHYFVDMKVRVSNYIDRMFAKYAPATFLSLFIDDCIAKGKDYYDRGPRYNTTYIQCTGLGTITDSLSSLRKHVFEDKTFTMEALLDAMADNFEEIGRAHV